MPAIDIQHLQHAYPVRSGEKRVVLKDLSFSVDTGEIFGLLGPNGGGKTTLFKILSTILRPLAGDAWLDGVSICDNPAEARRKIGVVFQNPSLDKKLTLGENLMHQGHLYGLRGTLLEERSVELLQKSGLLDRRNDLVEQLSGGLQRRGEIAKGLLHKPMVLLMDEPSTGLDPSARRDLWNVLLDLKKQGFTILLTTHLIEEADRCDRIAILNHGVIVAIGTPDDLKKNIGGDVISIQSKEPNVIAQKIKEKFGGDPVTLDNVVRIEKSNGAQFIPQLAEALPGLIDAITVGKPTLEDVFVRETGQRFLENG